MDYELRKPLTIHNSSLPRFIQYGGKLRRESSDTRNLWIPGGVYPDENRGRNDVF